MAASGATGRHWVWVVGPHCYLDEDGTDHPKLAPGGERMRWACHRGTRAGDLAVLYRSKQAKDIAYLFRATSDAVHEDVEERPWNCEVEVLERFDRPVPLRELRADPVTSTWSALRSSFVRAAAPVPDDVWARLMEMVGREPGSAVATSVAPETPMATVPEVRGPRMVRVTSRVATPAAAATPAVADPAVTDLVDIGPEDAEVGPDHAVAGPTDAGSAAERTSERSEQAPDAAAYVAAVVRTAVAPEPTSPEPTSPEPLSTEPLSTETASTKTASTKTASTEPAGPRTATRPVVGTRARRPLVDLAVGRREATVRAQVAQLRAHHPEASTEELYRLLEQRYAATLTAPGAAVGAAAAAAVLGARSAAGTRSGVLGRVVPVGLGAGLGAAGGKAAARSLARSVRRVLS